MPHLVKTDFVEAEIRRWRMLSLTKIRGSSEQNHDDLRLATLKEGPTSMTDGRKRVRRPSGTTNGPTALA